MKFLDRLFNRPPNQQQFATLLLKRIRASGDSRPVTFDANGFRLIRPEGKISFLGNIYQEYLRTDKSEREQLIRRFLTMWHTTELPIPDDFDDVKPDLLPALRARAYLEVDVPLAGDGAGFIPPYEVIGEHLALALVYDLPTSMMTVNDIALEKWGVSFYEAMEVAKRNLEEKPTQCAQVGSAYSLVNGDGYDATRMVSLDFIRQLDVPGDIIAMAPNRERLYIAGSDDKDGLAFMLHFAEQDVQHERYISGMAFRLEGDDWQPWLPPEEHALHNQFQQLRVQTMGQMYSDQARLLNLRHQNEDIDIFVVSFSGLKNESTCRLTSHCMWAEDVDSLLPHTDEVFFVRPEGESVSIVARGDWDLVCRLAGVLMEPQGLYPERWRVRQFPSADVLAQIGTK
jgi:hypothetical protein